MVNIIGYGQCYILSCASRFQNSVGGVVKGCVTLLRQFHGGHLEDDPHMSCKRSALAACSCIRHQGASSCVTSTFLCVGVFDFGVKVHRHELEEQAI